LVARLGSLVSAPNRGRVRRERKGLPAG